MIRSSYLDKYIRIAKSEVEDYINGKNNPKKNNKSKKNVRPSTKGLSSFATMKDIGTFIENNKKESESFSDILNRVVGETTKSAASICRKVGLNDTLLSKYVNGSRKINKINLLKLIIGLECNVKDAVDLLELSDFGYNKGSNLDLIIMAHLCERDYDLRKIDKHLSLFNEEILFNEFLYEED